MHLRRLMTGRRSETLLVVVVSWCRCRGFGLLLIVRGWFRGQGTISGTWLYFVCFGCWASLMLEGDLGFKAKVAAGYLYLGLSGIATDCLACYSFHEDS